jgi:gliding motility-associated-like protein
MKKIYSALFFFLLCMPAFSQFASQQKIVASDREPSGHFGGSVSISGNYAIVGAYSENYDTSGGNYMSLAGAAYMYEKTGGVWTQVQKIVASDRAAFDIFGGAVSISGNYAITGAWAQDRDASGGNPMTDAGAAYIFERIGGVWTQVQKIVASDRDIDDGFGSRVSISGNYAIVGAATEDDDASGGNPMTDAGSAYIFERIGGVWTQVQKIVAADRGAGDGFGAAVSISDSLVIVGAYQEDEDATGANTMLEAGSAYIFQRIGGTWTQVQKIVASDRAPTDFFGTAVSISGTYAVVGAYYEDEDETGGNTMSEAGSAYVFERNAGVWTQVQKIVASDRAIQDRFAGAVCISGSYIIVGAELQDLDASGGNPLADAGASYIFERTSGTWTQVQKIVALDRDQSDNFGNAVSISGSNVIVGAYIEDHDVAGGNFMPASGSAYVFGEVLNSSASSTNSLCNGQCNGTATATPTGGSSPYTYSWSTVPVQTTQTASGLCAGIYTVTITDASSNTVTATVSISEPPALNNTVTASANVLCSGGNNGSATVTATGGTPGYTYSWSPSGGTDSTATGLIAGSYIVAVTDSNGCVDTASVTITEPQPITAITASTNTNCGTNTGTATVTASNGTAPYTYLWSDAQNNSTATGLSAGVYTVTITDANNCTQTATVTVNSNAGPTANAGADVTITIGNSTVLTATGGGGYFWNTGDTTASIVVSPTSDTQYCVSVTDSNSCSDTACVKVFVEPIPCPTNTDLSVPNAFSPNNDGQNDAFCLQGWGYCIKTFSIRVFDRWGEKVFESTNPGFCWDGKYKGKPMDAAVFVYYIKATMTNNDEVVRKGNISLVR